MGVKVSYTAILNPGTYTVGRVVDLNSFAIEGKGTIGTSNKFYHIEIHVPLSGTDCQIYSEYGPTGRVQAKEFRHFSSQAEAEKEFEKILKSKLKKGYVEIDVAQRAIGSEDAKKIVKPVEFKNAECLPAEKKSLLHEQTARLIKELMGATNSFVVQTLKCPLGQLTNKQIDDGREILDKAKDAIKSGESPEVILKLTNKFYSMIPHNLGFGARGKMTELLLDTEAKCWNKQNDLDTLLDAKQIGAVLSADTFVDEQYASLNADFEYIEKNTSLFKWIDRMVHETGVYNRHGFGKLKVANAWTLTRGNERPSFIERANEIAKQCKKPIIPDPIKGLVNDRVGDVIDAELYKKANIHPLFHGTRSQNITGITKSGYLIRPAGAVVTGSMFGSEGLYYSTQAVKSINYTSLNGSHWSKGADSKGYLFINDIIMGDSFIPRGADSSLTLKKIAPNHCTYAIGGKSGVINDEIIVYDIRQATIRYLLEITN